MNKSVFVALVGSAVAQQSLDDFAMFDEDFGMMEEDFAKFDEPMPVMFDEEDYSDMDWYNREEEEGMMYTMGMPDMNVNYTMDYSMDYSYDKSYSNDYSMDYSYDMSYSNDYSYSSYDYSYDMSYSNDYSMSYSSYNSTYDYSYSMDYSYEPMMNYTMNYTESWEDWEIPPMMNSTMNNTMNSTESWEDWDDYYYDDYYNEDDTYYYGDLDEEYIDYDIAYMFAPYDWGVSKKWKDNYFCGGVVDPMTDHIAAKFPDEYFTGLSRDECFDWCKETKRELGYGNCCGHASYGDL